MAGMFKCIFVIWELVIIISHDKMKAFPLEFHRE